MTNFGHIKYIKYIFKISLYKNIKSIKILEDSRQGKTAGRDWRGWHFKEETGTSKEGFPFVSTFYPKAGPCQCCSGWLNLDRNHNTEFGVQEVKGESRISQRESHIMHVDLTGYKNYTDFSCSPLRRRKQCTFCTHRGMTIAKLTTV